MSIASEITRLQGVKADILQAISDKGVVVPAGSALDDCPNLIGQISGSSITPPYNVNFADLDFSIPYCKSSGILFETKNCHLTADNKMSMGPGAAEQVYFRIRQLSEQLFDWTEVEITIDSAIYENYSYIGAANQNCNINGNFGLSTWVGREPNGGSCTMYQGNYEYEGTYGDVTYLRYIGLTATFPLKLKIQLDRQTNVLTMFYNDVKISEVTNSYSMQKGFDDLHINHSDFSASADSIVISSIKIS